MEIIDFIIDAKLSGYAAGSGNNELKFEDGSKGSEYKSKEYRYLDRFYGFNPFSGSEFVFDSSGKLIWTMNYFGKIVQDCKDPSAIYNFLRDAMAKIDRDFPFRGPSKLEKDGYLYRNHQSGLFERFHGEECITKDDLELYKLHYHGGVI
jgi:hypothetical protein